MATKKTPSAATETDESTVDQAAKNFADALASYQNGYSSIDAQKLADAVQDLLAFSA